MFCAVLPIKVTVPVLAVKPEGPALLIQLPATRKSPPFAKLKLRPDSMVIFPDNATGPFATAYDVRGFITGLQAAAVAIITSIELVGIIPPPQLQGLNQSP